MNRLILGCIAGIYVLFSAVPIIEGDPGETATSYIVAISRGGVESYSRSPGDMEQAPHWYITEDGYVAATEEDLLDRAIFWAGMGNEKEFERFVGSSPLVFPLKGGMRVHLEGYSFCGKVKIRPEGSQITVWTIREAIRTETLF
jgi:hypothetical protein